MYQQRFQNIIQVQDSDQDQQRIILPQNIFEKIKTDSNGQNGYKSIKIHLDFSQIRAKYDFIHTISCTFTSVVLRCRKKLVQSEGQVCKKAEEAAVKICYNAEQEAAILNKLSQIKNCNSFVKIIQFYQNSLVLQLFDGNLKGIILQNNQLSTKFIIKLIRQCLKGLYILQQERIVHGDIKPENILFSYQGQNNFHFVLSDFSSSFSISQQKKPICKQTWSYKAPEWMKQNAIVDNKIDVWALGCVLFECMTGQNLLPLQIEDDKSYEKCIKNFVIEQQIKKRLQRFTYQSQIQKFQEILLSMLELDPQKRPTLTQLSQTFQKMQ